MTLIAYQDWTPSANTARILATANQLIEQYQAQRINLTLRALYYRFVSRFPLMLDPSGAEPNTQQNYKRLGDILNKGRLAGYVSWDALEDRTRNLQELPSWDDPKDFLNESPAWFRIPMWDNQPHYLEIWIEKDAGLGTIEGVCQRYQVPYFSCRGNTSQSEMWAAGQRFNAIIDRGQRPVVGYIGDHDPSGVDMTRDVQDRLDMFTDNGVMVQRLALNIDQILTFNPPPNPVKNTDSRRHGYRAMMRDNGLDPDACWEQDALDPSELVKIVEDTIMFYRDDDKWQEALERLAKKRGELKRRIKNAIRYD